MALAETSYRLGDPVLANDYYRQTLDQREAMAKLKPKDLKVLKELGDVYYMIGEFKLRCGELDAARHHMEKSRTGVRSWSTATRNVVLRRDLSLSLYRLGNLADLEKNVKAATQAYQAALAICEDTAKVSENNDRLRSSHALAHAGELARFVADRLSVGPNVDRELRIFLACCYAQIARATLPAHAELVQAALVKAVDAVRTAVRDGYRDRVYLETEPDLEPIRNRDDLKQIISEIPPA